MLRAPRLVLSIALLVSGGATALQAQSAQWELNGDLSSSTGNAALIPVGYPGAAGTPGVTFEASTIGGQPAQVAHLTQGTALAVLHGFGANGGGGYLNQYTIIIDFSSPGIGGWISLYQTNEAYNDGEMTFDLADSNDGDWFIDPSGAIGISGVYGGALTANAWYRLALVVDLVAGTYTSYINGAQVQQLTGQGLDGRFAMYTPDDPDPYDWFFLFADETGTSEMGEVLLNSFQLRNTALSSAEVAALGGPTALGIGVAPADCSASYFTDDFNGYADDAAVDAAGWQRQNTGGAVEDATWSTVTPTHAENCSARVNPPTRNGSPSTGKFIISDSDCANGGNTAGTGMSHDLISPAFSTLGGSSVWLHADVSAQLNNGADAVFDIDVSTDGGGTWTNAFRRVSPGRALPPVSDNSNADGFFGQLDLDLSALAANRGNVRLRFRHFEPTDDWWVALDDIVVDCNPAPAGGADTIFSESFAAGLGAMGVLSAAGNSGTETWHTTDKGNRYVAGTVSGRGVNRINHPNPLKEFAIMDSDADPDPPEQEYLVTPVLNLSSYCKVFLHYQSETVVSAGATQAVVYSLDGGASVAGVIFKYNDTTGTTGPNALFDDGEEPFYAERVLEVPAVAGQATVVFGFLYQSPGDQWWWAVDNVKVTGDQCEVVGETCNNPAPVAVPSSTGGTTAGASADNIGGCGGNESPAVWFKVTGTGRDITAQLCGSPFDTRMSLFDGACDALNCLGENDDSCGGASRIHWSSTAGHDYLLRVSGSGDADAGGFTLTILDSPVPANDLCASAVAIDLAAANPAMVDGTTRGATPDSEAPACGDIRAPGVWYSVSGTGGPMGATVCGTANFDSRISVFSGACGALVCITENDDTDGCSNNTSTVSWSSAFGESYLILVHGFDALPGRYHVGDFKLTVSGQPRPCLDLTGCRANQSDKSVTLVWDTVASGHSGFEITANGEVVGTVGPEETSFVHHPALTPGCFNAIEYSVAAAGVAFTCADTCRAVLSPGNVCFADDFEGYATDVDLELAGYFVIDVVPDPAGRPGETGTWTITNPGDRRNPPTFDGAPSQGQFAISDSDAADGDNGDPGSGNSNDLWSPSFSTVGKSSVWLHADVSAQMNNNGVVVFDVDYSTDGGQVWTNVFRQVAPQRLTAPPVVDATNADGFFGRLDVDLSAAADRPDVRFRLRSFEPSDDWWIAVDNVIVDDLPPPGPGSVVLFTEDFNTGLGGMTAVSLANPPNGGTETWTTAEKCVPPRSIVAAGGVFPIYDGRGVHRLVPPYAILESECDPDPVEDEYLVTPVLDCSELSAVFLRYKSETVVSAAIQQVLLSLDGGTTFEPTPVFSYNPGGLFDSGEEPFYAARAFKVPAAAGQAGVLFAFRYTSPGNQRYWAIDDIEVSGTPADLDTPFIRGDCNQDGEVCGSVSDMVRIIQIAVLSTFAVPSCPAACDANGDGLALTTVPDSISDVTFIANYCFLGTGPQPIPSSCGTVEGAVCEPPTFCSP